MLFPNCSYGVGCLGFCLIGVLDVEPDLPTPPALPVPLARNGLGYLGALPPAGLADPLGSS